MPKLTAQFRVSEGDISAGACYFLCQLLRRMIRGGATFGLGHPLTHWATKGCAVTSAAMVAAFYGIKTDPQQLNAFLTRTGGFTGDGLIHWNRVPLIAPAHLELAYNGAPSYELIDSNLLAGNPVIVLIKLPEGGYHFVVIVGKEARNYVIRDPAASPYRRAYRLRDLTDRIGGLCFFRRN
jgi:Peptidase_C39 like family